ncbi:phage capsid protein [Parasphingorhabdus sp.]|uniref:phage capsid protein n=1 Tax=Parasphingorhabdus sp. TaxID=2709688 RepID=UPI003A907D5E
MSNVTVSRLGQVNLANDVDALMLKVWSGEVLTAFNAACVYQDKHVTREIDGGKSAQFPATGKITADYHVPGTQLTGTPIAHNERVIVIDDLLVANTFIADIDEAKNHYDVRSEYTRQLGEALASAYDKNVARVAVLAAREGATITGEAGGSVINGGATVKTDGALIASALFASAQKFDENSVPDSERFALMRPATYYAAASSTDLINKDWGGRGSYADGKIETLAGITIVKSNHVPQTNESAAANVPTKYRGDFSATGFSVFHRSAVGTVRLMNLSMQSEYLTLFQATLLAARYAVGHGILRPECAIEVAAA